GAVGDRARRAGQAGGDQRPVRGLPGRAGPAASPGPAFGQALVSHLTEDGVDRRFIQVNVGHEADSSTAVYTHVSDDFMNTALRKALAPALEAGPGREEG
ncbi:MAG: hypothetical protein ACRDOA_23475, partial [Streptosporangiaceae bacterium]